MKYNFFFVSVFLLLTSCGNNECDSSSNFSGITKRNEEGIIVEPDKGDWGLKDKWSEREQALFETLYKIDCYPPSTFSIVAYPNPTDGVFQLAFNKSNATQVDIRLVDSGCRILLSHDAIKKNTIGLSAVDFDGNGIIRLYYKFIEDGCEYQGHGDIEIKS